MIPEIPAMQSVRNQNILFSKADLHYLESGRGRYGAGKEGLRMRKIWTRLILWKPSLLLSQGSHARQVRACPKAPERHKYNPLGAPRWLPIDIHSSESRRISLQG
jgi:hypothetical protein